MYFRALQLIKDLQLTKHPEGGYYKEAYRSEMEIFSPKINAKRVAITDIYFLLPKGEVSKFHSVSHDEIWHFYEGDKLKLHSTDPNGNNYKSSIIGDNNHGTINYKTVIKGEHWQAAETIGDYRSF